MNLKKLTLQQIKKLDAELEAKFNERIRKIKEEIDLIRKESDIIKKESEAIRKESDAIRKETDIIKKEAEELHKKNEQELEKLMIATGATNSKLKGLEDNIGYGVEEIFFESINKTKQIGKIVYDECTARYQMYNNKHKSLGEIDILLVNGKEIAIVEIKHRVGKKAIEQLMKVAHLFEINNNHNKFKLNLFMAGLSLHASARQLLKINNIGFIKIRGEHFELVKM